MTNEELSALSATKSAEWKEGFLAAVNLDSNMKAAFLKRYIGQTVSVQEAPCSERDGANGIAP